MANQLPSLLHWICMDNSLSKSSLNRLRWSRCGRSTKPDCLRSKYITPPSAPSHSPQPAPVTCMPRLASASINYSQQVVRSTSSVTSSPQIGWPALAPSCARGVTLVLHTATRKKHTFVMFICFLHNWVWGLFLCWLGKKNNNIEIWGTFLYV